MNQISYLTYLNLVRSWIRFMKTNHLRFCLVDIVICRVNPKVNLSRHHQFKLNKPPNKIYYVPYHNYICFQKPSKQTQPLLLRLQLTQIRHLVRQVARMIRNKAKVFARRCKTVVTFSHLITILRRSNLKLLIFLKLYK